MNVKSEEKAAYYLLSFQTIRGIHFHLSSNITLFTVATFTLIFHITQTHKESIETFSVNFYVDSNTYC